MGTWILYFEEEEKEVKKMGKIPILVFRIIMNLPKMTHS